jgi:hypothetical protein
MEDVKSKITTTKKILAAISLSMLVSSCGWRAADNLNPFSDPAPEELGMRNSRALLDEAGGTGGEAERARHHLQVLGQYRAAAEPQPAYPVVQPAEVRLMWVPDRINKAGDLVPAHYYYLKVLHDRWAVQDAFELEEQLNRGSGSSGSAVPWTQGGSR